MPHEHKVNDKHKYNCNKIKKKMKKYFVWEKFETKTTAWFFLPIKGNMKVGGIWRVFCNIILQGSLRKIDR